MSDVHPADDLPEDAATPPPSPEPPTLRGVRPAWDPPRPKQRIGLSKIPSVGALVSVSETHVHSGLTLETWEVLTSTSAGWIARRLTPQPEIVATFNQRGHTVQGARRYAVSVLV